MVQQIHQATKESSQKNTDTVWRRYKQDHQWHTYKKERNVYNRLLRYHNRQALTKQVKDNKNNTKSLFNLVNKITNSKVENPMPLDKNPEELVEEFATFFLEKIEKTYNSLKTIPAYQLKMTDTPLLMKFSPLTKDKIYKEIMEMKNKSCELNTKCSLVLKTTATCMYRHNISNCQPITYFR